MLIDQIQQELKQAMLNRDLITTSTLRMVLASTNNARINKGSDLSDEEIITIIQKEAKQRDEAIMNARQVSREDLINKNEQEKLILIKYLPTQMSEEEVRETIKTTILETGATSKAEMGKVMAAVMNKLKGQAEGSLVSRIVSELLTQ